MDVTTVKIILLHVEREIVTSKEFILLQNDKIF